MSRTLKRAIQQSRGDFIIVCERSLSLESDEIENLVGPLKEGADVSVGFRSVGRENMPVSEHVVVSLLSSLLHILFRTEVRDCLPGICALRREIVPHFDAMPEAGPLCTMVLIRASLLGLRVAEAPVHYRRPEVRFPGFDELRKVIPLLPFLVMLGPGVLITVPFASSVSLGALLFAIAMLFPQRVGEVGAFVAVLATSAVLLGFQFLLAGYYLKAYALSRGLISRDRLLHAMFPDLHPARGLLWGLLLLLLGLFLLLRAFPPLSAVSSGGSGAVLLLLALSLTVSGGELMALALLVNAFRPLN